MMQKWKCQCFDRIARELSNKVNFHFKVTLIIANRVHAAQWMLMISFEFLSAFLEREYNKNKLDAGLCIEIITAFLDWHFLF